MRRLFVSILLLSALSSYSQTSGILSVTLENVDYAYPVHNLSLNIDGQDVRMVYMDVKPSRPNGKTLMLFHGKNFAGYYWTNVIKAFSEKGYRVVIPDQIGFGKSSRPVVNYSFHRLASYNRQLMDSLKIQQAVIMGHSMGGMLATRFALLYPDRTAQLVLENPIGLEDYRMFVPYASPEALYQTELKATAESIKKYYQTSYFVHWKPEYDELVRIASGINGSSEFPRYARVSALTAQMIYEQPVVHEFPLIKVPVLLLIGTRDKTIVGKARLSPEDQKKYGIYDQLGKQTAARIPGAKLIEFKNSGHIPHLEIPDEFMKALAENIK